LTDIKDTLESLKASSDMLQESSDQISELTSSIDEFSNQANLLALNAMIEVAKVGTSGKALSELAEEISTLATKSAGVASGIGEIVQSVREKESDD
jgi:methyl-accepting chemotaxis protein